MTTKVPLNGSKVTTPEGSTPTEEKFENGQYKDYWVLSAEELDKGFIRPFRDSYEHTICNSITTMAYPLAATYAREPRFYSRTFCCKCGGHYPVSQFYWKDTDEFVGS